MSESNSLQNTERSNQNTHNPNQNSNSISASRHNPTSNQNPTQNPNSSQPRLHTRSFLNVSHSSHNNPLHHLNSTNSNIKPHSPIRGSARAHQSLSETSPHLHPHQNASSSEQPQDVIYGTNICTRTAITNLQSFIMEFEFNKYVPIERDLGEEGGQMECVSEKIYHTALVELDLYEKNIVTVSGKHLKEFDRDLYYQMIYFPVEMITIFDEALQLLYEKICIQEEETENEYDAYETRKKHLKKSKIMCAVEDLEDSEVFSMKQLSTTQINKLMCVKGIVIRCSEIYPDMKSATFQCTNCKFKLSIVLENARVSEPTTCEVCKLKNSLAIEHNLCEFTDKQFVKLQELPELVPEGETPSSMTLITYNDNVDRVRPGDRMEIVGIYRVTDKKVFKNQKVLKSIYSSHLDVISFRRIHEQNNLKIEASDDRSGFGPTILYSDEDKNKFTQMADSPTVLDDLIASFAPSIFGNEQIKKGLLSQLFAGTKKDFASVGRSHFRSDINICLVGDPSTAKSQLLQQVHKISSRGVYTSGRGSSAVGLTANVRRDPETKEFVLQSGALVLSDLGICCIDEFDKMDPQNRLILLEAMEQQTISIAKGGIVCQLNSRTAILCAANPVNSKYNPKKSVIENINLTPALLTRFDLIFLMLDQPNEVYDHRLASHILSLYSSTGNEPPRQRSHNAHISSRKQNSMSKPLHNQYSRELLSKYITYAKQYIHPQLTEESGNMLIEAYSEMRKLGTNKKIITATTRQLESLIRISESFAKMRLSSKVEVKDVQEAVNLVKYATQQAATDPTTGLIDMDVLITGKTSMSRDRINKIKEKSIQILRANTKKFSNNTSIESFLVELNKKWDAGLMGSESTRAAMVNEKEMLEALRVLQSEGVVVVFGQNKLKPLFKLARQLGR